MGGIVGKQGITTSSPSTGWSSSKAGDEAFVVDLGGSPAEELLGKTSRLLAASTALVQMNWKHCQRERVQNLSKEATNPQDEVRAYVSLW